MGKLIEKHNGKLPKGITINGVNKASLKKIASYTFEENYISLNEKNYQLFFLINEKANTKEISRFEKFWGVNIKIVNTPVQQNDQRHSGDTGITIATMKKIAMYIFGDNYVSMVTKKGSRFIITDQKENQFIILSEGANRKEANRFQNFWGIDIKII